MLYITCTYNTLSRTFNYSRLRDSTLSRHDKIGSSFSPIVIRMKNIPAILFDERQANDILSRRGASEHLLLTYLLFFFFLSFR